MKKNKKYFYKSIVYLVIRGIYTQGSIAQTKGSEVTIHVTADKSDWVYSIGENQFE